MANDDVDGALRVAARRDDGVVRRRSGNAAVPDSRIGRDGDGPGQSRALVPSRKWSSGGGALCRAGGGAGYAGVDAQGVGAGGEQGVAGAGAPGVPSVAVAADEVEQVLDGLDALGGVLGGDAGAGIAAELG